MFVPFYGKESEKLIVRHANGQQRGNSMLSFVFLSDNGNEGKLGQLDPMLSTDSR